MQVGPFQPGAEIANWASRQGLHTYSQKEAQIVIEKWRVEYNTKRPHSGLGYRLRGAGGLLPLGSKSIFTAHG